MRKAWLFGVLAGAVGLLAEVRVSNALDVLGGRLFGESSPVSADALSYNVALNVDGSNGGALKDLIAGVSRLVAEQERGANDTYTLVARARGDVALVQTALYSEGYYAGEIDIRIGGNRLEALDPGALSIDGDASVEVALNIVAGPRFVFGTIDLVRPLSSSQAPDVVPQDIGLSRGAPAKSGNIVAASEKLVQLWRSAGYPLAQIAHNDVMADHARNAVDIRMEVDPGPPAVYGWIGVSGAQTLDSGTILSQSALQPGQTFRTADLNRARERLVQMPGVQSVRIVEGDAVDADGSIPINLEVMERKPRYFGATASLSSTDGAEVQAYWGHRSFFGEGEHLRLEGGLSRLGSDGFSQLEFDAAAIYTKPGILDIDTNLFSEFRLRREHPDAYESLDASFKIGLTRVISPTLSGSVALATKFSRVEDAFGDKDHLLVTLPIEAAYDTRDNPLEPMKGLSIVAGLAPTVETIAGTVFNKIEFQAAAYRALDADGRAVLAGRIGAGSIAGSSLSDVPASTRFFAGGGGSVRGYEYRSLGPSIAGEVVGGLGYVSASAELRLRVTERFGIVPFVDVASVTDDAWLGFSGNYFFGAGVGLRYYTALGPIRIDIATPLTDRDSRSAAAVYVGLGQAF